MLSRYAGVSASRATLRILNSQSLLKISTRSFSKSTILTQKQGAKSTKQTPLWLKLKNATTFTLSGVLVIGAIGISTIVIYLIGSELFSPSGDTQLFNRAVSLVQKDKQLRELLQSNDTLYNERLKAYGEMITHDRWTRNRPIVSKRRLDKDGNVHCFLRFHIESKKKIGLVHCEAVEKQGSLLPDFISLYVDIKGEKRYFIIKPKLKKEPKASGFLGVNWGPKKA
ncbi:mitochondrial import inner membrane translocase subunit tim21 [Maudiozyma exigua]|uniref:Mitochondrial import inner membrane translocase subunit Tim21 n=1 Tax=Maudiozyma exigua TaxID=34358 RepID=A0A9P6W362_MAUEX|nr:mitochondrial import inner membrane translocase subunit tim21 [Kazachstania exigua]